MHAHFINTCTVNTEQWFWAGIGLEICGLGPGTPIDWTDYVTAWYNTYEIKCASVLADDTDLYSRRLSAESYHAPALWADAACRRLAELRWTTDSPPQCLDAAQRRLGNGEVRRQVPAG